jgi:hypothetical protein
MMARLWRLHFYIGMFIAPSVLFFALTGALQLFSLHEAHGDYRPPLLIEELSQVHKDQVFAPGHHRPPPGAKATGAKPAGEGSERAGKHENAAPPREAEHGPPLSALLLKVFFLVVATGLVVSTVLGLITGLSHPRRRRAALAFVAAGLIVPILLLLI